MVKSLLAILAGAVGGFAIVAVVEGLGHTLYPPPPGTDLANPEQLRELFDKLPTGAIIAVLVAWGLGAFFGGSVAAIATAASMALPPSRSTARPAELAR